MKQETKMNSLINKLVTFKNGDDHFKGFLFHNEHGYFIKPIDVFSGKAKETVSFYLTSNQFEFINFCESPKLMKVSMKSWHYKLVKYVLGSNAPTPHTMQNGCPYFWLFVFSLIVVTFVFTIRTLANFIIWLPNILWNLMEAFADMTLSYFPEEKVWQTDYNGYPGRYKVPILARAHFKRTREGLLEKYIKVNYGIDKQKDYERYLDKVKELRSIYEQWRLERDQKWENDEDRKARLWEAGRKEREAAKERRIARKLKRERFWRPFNKAMDKLGQGTVNALSFDYKHNIIIKRTKAFIGLLIGAATLALSILVVDIILYLVIAGIDGVAWLFANYSDYIIKGGLIIVAIGLIVLVAFGLYNWIESVIGRYKAGRKAWYAVLFMYLLIYPIAILGKAVYYMFYYILGLPLVFIFYTVIYQRILVNVGIFLWGIIRMLGSLLIGSLGIFGEYFGASKKDYCPGIEWTDTE